jgi:hypothetical protein
MANPFGSGTAMVIPLPSRKGDVGVAAEAAIDETSTVRVREARAQEPAQAPIDPPEVAALLTRIVGLLGSREEGLTAQELRSELNERPERLQRAIAAGLRARKFRRSGSRCRLRYILN